MVGRQVDTRTDRARKEKRIELINIELWCGVARREPRFLGMLPLLVSWPGE